MHQHQKDSNQSDGNVVRKIQLPLESGKILDKLTRSELDKFQNEFKTIITKGSSEGFSIFSFTQRELIKFHLERRYSTAHLLSEAHFKGIEHIISGGIIINPTGWIRGTIYRTIRELSRDTRKQRLRELPLEEEITADSREILDPQELVEDFSLVRQALNKLDPLNQRIITLKVVRRLSYQSISEMLLEEGYGSHTVTALRARKSRALKDLRRIYHLLKQSRSLD